ncbi:MAG: phosphoglycerate kinase [Candidatus Competibacteraceae bacterium]
MNFKRMTDLDLAGKRVFIRSDLNVPVKSGKVTSDARITASMPTIEFAMKAGAKVMVTSHLGRPTEGEFKEEDSLNPVAEVMSAKLGKPVRVIRDWVNGGFEVADGEVVLLENCRVNKGEKKNVEETAKKYAALCDVFVMDTPAPPIAEASTHGVAKFAAPVACAGILLTEELDALTKALKARPAVGRHRRWLQGFDQADRVGKLVREVDQLVVGGGIASTFLKAVGKNVGKSLCEDDLVSTSQALLENESAARMFRSQWMWSAARSSCCRTGGIEDAGAVSDDDMIFDIGPKSAQELADIIMKGRHGGVERPGRRVRRVRPVQRGTKTVAMAIANTRAFLAGGSDTIAAIKKCNCLRQGVLYISTAGGAFLEFLEGRCYPPSPCWSRGRTTEARRFLRKTGGCLSARFFVATRNLMMGLTKQRRWGKTGANYQIKNLGNGLQAADVPMRPVECTIWSRWPA